MDTSTQALAMLIAAAAALLLMGSCAQLEVGVDTPYGTATYDGSMLHIRPAIFPTK